MLKMVRIKKKMIMVILIPMCLVIGMNFFISHAEETKDASSKEGYLLELPEISPYTPDKKKEEKISSSFLLAEPVIAAPIEKD